MSSCVVLTNVGMHMLSHRLGLYLPLAPGLYLPGDTSIPGDQLNELALPVNPNQANILLYTRQLEDASPSTCKIAH